VTRLAGKPSSTAVEKGGDGSSGNELASVCFAYKKCVLISGTTNRTDGPARRVLAAFATGDHHLGTADAGVTNDIGCVRGDAKVSLVALRISRRVKRQRAGDCDEPSTEAVQLNAAGKNVFLFSDQLRTGRELHANSADATGTDELVGHATVSRAIVPRSSRLSESLLLTIVRLGSQKCAHEASRSRCVGHNR
jgi:hypothetical protein